MMLIMCKDLSECFIFTTYSFNCMCVKGMGRSPGAQNYRPQMMMTGDQLERQAYARPLRDS